MTISKDVCPNCGREIEQDPYMKEGVAYCCESCAMGKSCECEHQGKYVGERHPG